MRKKLIRCNKLHILAFCALWQSKCFPISITLEVLLLYKYSAALIALSVGLFSASQAKASTLDTFSLTGNGDTFAFSLLSPSNPATGNSCPNNGSGDFCYTGISVSDNGNNQTDTIEFTASGGLDIFDHHGNSIIDLSLKNNQALYFTEIGNPPTVTFKGGTFSLSNVSKGDGGEGDDYCDECNRDPNYSLVIDPPSAVPEPSSLALMSTGLFAAAGAVRRRMKK
jgi:hypothetical protein